MSALQDGKSSEDQLHNEVNVFNTSEWLRWYILCYVYFTTIRKKKWDSTGSQPLIYDSEILKALDTKNFYYSLLSPNSTEVLKNKQSMCHIYLLKTRKTLNAERPPEVSDKGLLT